MIFSSIKNSAVPVVVLALVGCSSGGSTNQQDNESENTQVVSSELGVNDLLVAQAELEWSACESFAGLECASLSVPMDYNNPSAENINIQLARLARSDRSQIERTLLINPGGPGVSGIEHLNAFRLRSDVSAELRSAFDIVSFDPRGIGLSAPVSCGLTPLFQQDQYTINRDEIDANLALSLQFTTGCVEQEGEYLQQIGSYNVVRDINEIRKAQGLAQFDFLAYSYGSRLAALYMQTFPESVGRFVIDGSLPPSSSIATALSGTLAPGQANIDNLVQACIGESTLCVPEEFAAALQQRVNELGAEPTTTESALMFSILELAMKMPGFEQLLIGRLDSYLENNNDVSELEVLDNILGLSESSEGGSLVNVTANIAVLCADDAFRPTSDSLTQLATELNAESDLLAELIINNIGQCAHWPQALNPIPDIATNQAPAALVIGGPTDAQTPLVFAEQMAQAIGGQFLRSEHAGHTTVFLGKNKCTDGVVENFLLTAELPSFSSCEAETVAVSTDWHDEFLR